MAFLGKAEKRDEEIAPAPGSAPATTFLDEGCELSGELRFKESVRIDGKIEGEIAGLKTVVVGETAVVRANIRSDSVVIYGTVEGDVVAQRKITLHKSAKVTGEMHTAGIVIEEGARFKGQIVIGSDDPAAARGKPAQAPSSNAAGPARAQSGK